MYWKSEGTEQLEETEAVIESLFESLHARAAASRGQSSLRLDEWVDLTTALRITQALRDCRGNRSAAARALGIGRRTLYTKMQKLGVEVGWAPPPVEEWSMTGSR